MTLFGQLLLHSLGNNDNHKIIKLLQEMHSVTMKHITNFMGTLDGVKVSPIDMKYQHIML